MTFSLLILLFYICPPASRPRTRSETHHLQQRQVAGAHVVEVDLDVLPARAFVDQRQALAAVVDLVDGEHLVAGGVDAVVVLAGKQVDAHDAEDEPEDEAHQQHVHDGRDGAQQSVDHHLGEWVPPPPTQGETNGLGSCDVAVRLSNRLRLPWFDSVEFVDLFPKILVLNIFN